MNSILVKSSKTDYTNQPIDARDITNLFEENTVFGKVGYNTVFGKVGYNTVFGKRLFCSLLGKFLSRKQERADKHLMYLVD